MTANPVSIPAGIDSQAHERSAKAQRRLQVAVVHRRLAHYRVPLYAGILESNPNIGLTVYCGGEGDRSTSGLALDSDSLDYVKEVRNYPVRWVGTEFIFQPGVLFGLLRNPPDVVVFEGRVLLLSSLPLLIWRRATGRKNVIWLKGWPNATGEGRLSRLARTAYLKLAHHYIVYGKSSIPRLEHYGVDRTRITVAQNTVDVTGLLTPEPAGTNLPESPQVKALLEGGGFVLNVGRLVKNKAVGELLTAFASLRAEADGAAIKLAIVGRGPESERLQARARELNVQDHVVFTGAISDGDAELLFRSARCCVFPGAVGLALNQALAAGRPVICADESGPDSELLVHEENGLRVPAGDIGALAAAIRRLLSDRALAESLGARGRETMQRTATIQNMIARYTDALMRAAGR
jgi:glycosyltransferase involved in cell wall biosynthesis